MHKEIARKGVFDCHLSPVGLQMAIEKLGENPVSNDFLSTSVDSINVFIFAYPV